MINILINHHNFSISSDIRKQQQPKLSPLSSSLKTQKSRSSSKSRAPASRNSMGSDGGATAAASASATHAPVKRLSQQSSSSAGNSPSTLSLSVPSAGSRVSSNYATEESTGMRSISPGPGDCSLVTCSLRSPQRPFRVARLTEALGCPDNLFG